MAGAVWVGTAEVLLVVRVEGLDVVLDDELDLGKVS